MKKIHMKSFSKPWITPNVQRLIDKKNKRFRIKRIKNTETNKNKYKISSHSKIGQPNSDSYKCQSSLRVAYCI